MVMNATKNDWLTAKVPNTDIEQYEFHDRANLVYNHWLAGYAECEIAAYFKVPEADVIIDLQHVRSNMTPRQQLAHGNDRARLVVQREQQSGYNRLLRESLTITAPEYLNKGMSPAGVLKEYREAVGLTEKPGGVNVSFTKNTAIMGGGNGGGSIRSFEDLVRSIISVDPSCALSPPEVEDDILEDGILEGDLENSTDSALQD